MACTQARCKTWSSGATPAAHTTKLSSKTSLYRPSATREFGAIRFDGSLVAYQVNVFTVYVSMVGTDTGSVVCDDAVPSSRRWLHRQHYASCFSTTLKAERACRSSLLRPARLARAFTCVSPGAAGRRRTWPCRPAPRCEAHRRCRRSARCRQSHRTQVHRLSA